MVSTEPSLEVNSSSCCKCSSRLGSLTDRVSWAVWLPMAPSRAWGSCTTLGAPFRVTYTVWVYLALWLVRLSVGCVWPNSRRKRLPVVMELKLGRTFSVPTS